MADQSFLFLLLIVIFNLFFFSHSLPTAAVSTKDKAPGVEKVHEFSYEVGSKKGPEHWAEIKNEWQVCKSGNSQSPIDIVQRSVKPFPGLGCLKRNYKLAPAVLINRGHDISVSWRGGDAGDVTINGTAYKLLQSHWHTPSEHTLNGKRYDMELHMVHNSSCGYLAVISVMYELGCPDPFLQQFLNHVKKGVTEVELGNVHPNDIKFGSSNYYRYVGSLTTPPCLQGILWTIINEVMTVSREQLSALREAVEDGFQENARPTQPLNGREVYMYRPEVA